MWSLFKFFKMLTLVCNVVLKTDKFHNVVFNFLTRICQWLDFGIVQTQITSIFAASWYRGRCHDWPIVTIGAGSRSFDAAKSDANFRSRLCFAVVNGQPVRSVASVKIEENGLNIIVFYILRVWVKRGGERGCTETSDDLEDNHDWYIVDLVSAPIIAVPRQRPSNGCLLQNIR